MEIKEIGIESKVIPDEEKSDIIEIIDEIKKNQNSNEVYPQKLFDLHYYINDIKEKKYPYTPEISDLFSNEHIFLFRTFLIQEKGVRIIALKILRNKIQIYPPFTQKLLDAIRKKIQNININIDSEFKNQMIGYSKFYSNKIVSITREEAKNNNLSNFELESQLKIII